MKNGSIKYTGDIGNIFRVTYIDGVFLYVENGTFEGEVAVLENAFEIFGGEFDSLSIFPWSSSTASAEKLKGGSFGKIVSIKSLADALADDYYIYDANDRVINTVDLELVENRYTVENVTVKKGADLSVVGNATVTLEYDSKPYNGEELEPTVTVTVGGHVLIKDTDYTVTYSNNTNAGTATVTVTGSGAYSGTASETFTIEKATPEASHFNLSGDATYDGNVHTAHIYLKSGIKGMGEIIGGGCYDANGTFVADPINAGTYTVKLNIVEGDNYKAVTDLVLGTITIEKATPVVTAPTPISGLRYNGESQALINAGSTTGGTMTYALFEGELLPNVSVIFGLTWNTHIPTATNAGIYTVFYKVEGNDNNNDVAEQYVTVTIGEATPTLNVTAPVSSVLPGNTILLSYTLTGVKGEELTNLVGIGSAKVGDLDCVIDGLKVTVPSTAVIGGEDQLVVTLTSVPGGNYGASEEFTLTLDIGMPDFTGDIAELEADLGELNDLITSKADADEITKKLTEITNKIQTLEDNGATDAELAQVKQEVTDAYTKAIEDAVGELETKIAAQIDPDELATEIKKVTDLIDALEAADETLDGKITDAVNTAKSDLATAVSTLEDKIADEVEKLQNQINSNDTDIDGINASITTINGLIEALKKADEVLDGDISEAITKAENELKAAQEELKDLIGDVQSNLDNAKADLDKAISDLEAAMNKGDADLSTKPISSTNSG